MPVTANKNTSYGPELVTQKYSPLANIQYDVDQKYDKDETFYGRIMVNRRALFAARNLIPQPLKLAVANWTTTATNEAGHLPPLVVISSNRSGYIKAGIATAAAQLAKHNIGIFTGVQDLRALLGNADDVNQSPPIYCQSRIGANRNVYVVVHISEYDTYTTALAGLGIRVVGWVFNAPPGESEIWLAGFGASRFAAIAFCKQLRTRVNAAALPAGPASNFAWLIDDNVVALSSFPGLGVAEAALAPAQVCAGFHAAGAAESFVKNKEWANREQTSGRPAPAQMPDSKPPGILQQMVLWNIAYLDANNINFAPIFVASGEDVSLGNFFDKRRAGRKPAPVPYLYYTGIGIRKEIVEPKAHDNGKAGKRVSAGRQALARWIAEYESPTPGMVIPSKAPPPIEITPTDPKDGGLQTVGSFVVTRVLPVSGFSNKKDDADTQNNAKCQAGEQILCGAIKANCVSEATNAVTFTTAGTFANAITPLNK
jgi:hypothetical protein